MYTLFTKPGACSRAIHVALIEAGAEYEIRIEDTANPSPEFLAANPRAQVPTLLADGQALREGAAILTWVLEKEGSALIPTGNGWDRAEALQWLAWANSSLHPAYGRLFMTGKSGLPEETKKELGKQYSQGVFSFWKEAEKRLENSKYLAGDRITAADILVTVISHWKPDYLSEPVRFGPNVSRLIAEVTSRPSWQQALQEEKQEAAKQQAA